MRAFECRGCSAMIFIKKTQKEPLWCPICRMGMVEVKVKISEDVKKYKCPECGYEFFVNKSLNPYKCPNCNYTFMKTLGKIQDERL